MQFDQQLLLSLCLFGNHASESVWNLSSSSLNSKITWSSQVGYGTADGMIDTLTLLMTVSRQCPDKSRQC